MNDLFVFGDNSDLRDFIYFLLEKLPESAKESVLNDCIVITINNDLDGFYIPGGFTRDKSVIALSYLLFEKNPTRFIKTFYHEVAHHWLGHRVLFGRDEKLEQKQEEEADKLVNEWFLKTF